MDIIGEENMPIFDLPDSPSGKSDDATETVKEEQTLDECAQFSHLSKASTLVDSTVYEDMSLFKRVIVVEIEMNIIKAKKKAKGKKNQRRWLTECDEEELQPSSSSSAGYAGYGSAYTPSRMYAQPRYTATSYYGYPANQRTRTKNGASNPSRYHQYGHSHDTDDTDPDFDNPPLADRNEAYYAFSRPDQSDYKRRSHAKEYMSYDSRTSKANNYYYQPWSDPHYEQKQQSPYYSTPPVRRRNAASPPSSQRPMTRRSSSPKSPTSPKKPTPPLTTQATEADARSHRIPPCYSLKYWDPSEQPFTLLGSVFDGNSLGKWIYDWTVYTYGPATPQGNLAGELWLLHFNFLGK